MAKVLDLVDIQDSDIPSKRPASSTAGVPVAKRPALSRMSVNEEGGSPDVSVCNYLLILLFILCI